MQENLIYSKKTGNLVKNIGRGAVMALGTPLVAASEAENARMQEQLRDKSRVTGDSEVERVKTPAEIIEDKRMARLERTAELKKEERDDKEAKAMNMLKAKAGEIETYSIPANSTTADRYGQDFVPNQTSSMVIDRKMEQGSQIADSTPNIAEVLSESQDSIPVDESFPVGDARRNMRSVEEIEQNLQDDMETASLTRIGGPEGGVGKSQLAKFLTQKGLDQALLGAIGERMIPEPRIGDSSPLIDHPDLPGGEDDISLPSGTNTSPTTNLQEQTGGGESLNERYMEHAEEMRAMEAQERKGRTKIDRRVGKNLLEQRAIANEEAIDSGFMNLDDEGRKEESIRLGSKFGIPNKTDMAEIRKSPEFIASQESMKPKSVAEKTDDFTAKFVEGSQSDIVRGRRGNRSLGITRIPATNGDAQVGFVLANKPLDKSPTTATTYGFGVAPGAEGLLDNQLNQESFSDYMQRGLGEAKEGKKRKAGEIFEFLPPSARVVSGTARLGDIIM